MVEQVHEISHSVHRPLPKKINLGSGKNWREDFLNVDILPRVNPDWLLDICQLLPYDSIVKSARFGEFTLQRGMFDLIVANDVLEHLPDLVSAMTSCLDLLVVGGQMQIHVPYDLSYGAWQDPTHVRAFNEKSWLYYTDWYWYIGWKAHRFHLQKLVFLLSPHGLDLQKKGMNVDDIVRTPRAVDAMSVVLEKIVVTS